MLPTKTLTIDSTKYYEYSVVVPEFKATYLVMVDSNHEIVIREAIARAITTKKIPIVITKVSHN